MSDHPLYFLKDYSATLQNEQHETTTTTTVDNNPVPAGQEPAPNGKPVKRKRQKKGTVPKREIERKAAREQRVKNRQVVNEKCNCIFLCAGKISAEQRKVLNEKFWLMKYSEQKAFVKSHSEQGKVKRRRVPIDPLGGEQELRRAFTYKFYLPDESGQLQTVCCAFFLNTIGYRSKCSTIIYRAHNKPDKTGRVQTKRERPLHDAVWEDILSYSPRTYHKGEKYKATALYLPTKLNVKIMHADFNIKQQKKEQKSCSYGFYYKVLNEVDVHFVDMDDFPIPEREVPPIAADTEVSGERLAIQQIEQYQSLPANQSASFHCYPVEHKPIVPSYASIPYQAPQNYHVGVVKQEVAAAEYAEEDNNDYTEQYLDEYSESGYHNAARNVEVEVAEPKIEILHEEYLGPVDQHPEIATASQSLPVVDSQPNQVPTKKKRPKQASEPGAQALLESYPPVKRSKRSTERAYNRIKRRQTHVVVQADCNCIWNCKDKISLEQQARINGEYWKVGFCDQRMFLLEHTERHSIKRRRSKSEETRKDFTYSYRLTDANGQYQQVCCQFFLNTIGYDAHSSSVIYRAHQAELSQAISDKRGKREQTAREIALRDAVDNDLLSYFSPEQQESGAPLDFSATDWYPKKLHKEYLRRQAALGNDKPASFSYYYRRTRELKMVFAPKPEPKKEKSRKRPQVEFLHHFNLSQ